MILRNDLLKLWNKIILSLISEYKIRLTRDYECYEYISSTKLFLNRNNKTETYEIRSDLKYSLTIINGS